MVRPAAVCIICGKIPGDEQRSIVVILADHYPLRFCEACIRLLYLMITTPMREPEA